MSVPGNPDLFPGTGRMSPGCGAVALRRAGSGGGDRPSSRPRAARSGGALGSASRRPARWPTAVGAGAGQPALPYPRL